MYYNLFSASITILTISKLIRSKNRKKNKFSEVSKLHSISMHFWSNLLHITRSLLDFFFLWERSSHIIRRSWFYYNGLHERIMLIQSIMMSQLLRSCHGTIVPAKKKSVKILVGCVIAIDYRINPNKHDT